MSPHRRQAALSLLTLAGIGLIALASRPDTSTTIVAAAASPSTLAFTQTTTPDELETTSTSTSTTAPASPREISVTVYPSDVQAAIEATAGGATETAEGSYSGSVVGDVELQVVADGYRTETLTIPADRSGEVEVFLDPEGQIVDKLLAFSTGHAPKQVAFTPDGSELWVTLLGGDGVEVYDPVTGSRLDELDLPEAGAVEVIFDDDGGTAWVSQMETARVYEVDVASRQVERTLETEGSWTKVMALSPDGRRLFASNWVSNDVSEFDLSTGTMLRRIPTVTTPRGLAFDDSGTTLYVAGYEHGQIQEIDLETGESTVLHETGGAMRHLVGDPSGETIYASDMAGDSIYGVDTSTGDVSEVATTDRLPNTIDVSPDGRILAVSNRGRNNPESYYLPGPEWGSILLIDSETGDILDAVVGGNQPTGLDISADGRFLAFSDFLDNRVTVLSLPPTPTLLEGGGGRRDSYRAELTK